MLSLGRRNNMVALTQYTLRDNVTSPEHLQYSLGKKLGSGTYAKVKAAWSPYQKKMIAIKIIEKLGATREFLDKFLPREISALERVRHPNILSVYRLVETPLQVYFMMEIAHNGDLLDYINAVRTMPEPQARFVTRGISAGIAHCHDRGIVHRDLKCENIMLTRDMNVKIGDFGFARQVDDRCTGVSTPCGSFSYAAPELFADESGGSTYDAKKADIWSMGCILYAMVCGRLPFGDDSQVAKNLNRSRPLEFSAGLTEDCKTFIQLSMLNTDVAARCSIGALRSCHWMQGPTSALTPYRHVVYTEENCLPAVVVPDPSPAESTSCRPTLTRQLDRGGERSVPQPSEPGRSAQNRPSQSASMEESRVSGPNIPPAATPRTREIHRRNLEHSLRVMMKSDAITLSALVKPKAKISSAGPAGIKAKISSAGKKVLQTFLNPPSSHVKISYQAHSDA